MITVGEVRTIAGALGVAPTIVDHDYALGCCLFALAEDETVAREWLFKGGTCLSKCHFDLYRFSEDLDFTAISAISEDHLRSIVQRASDRMVVVSGIQTGNPPNLIDVIDDDYGRESFEARIYFRAAWNFGGSAPTIRIHVSRDEQLIFPPAVRPIAHPYSDQQSLPHVTIRTYALEEVCSEKLRAFSGQRKHAIARDVFDLHQLSKRSLCFDAVVEAFPAKCEVKGIDPFSLRMDHVCNREQAYRLNWERSVQHLIPASMRVSFEECWTSAVELLARVVKQ
jgi:predicted nucleotidyltransferase component of viral defense system